MSSALPARRRRRVARRLALALFALLLGGGLQVSTMDSAPDIALEAPAVGALQAPSLSAAVSAGLPIVDDQLPVVTIRQDDAPPAEEVRAVPPAPARETARGTDRDISNERAPPPSAA